MATRKPKEPENRKVPKQKPKKTDTGVGTVVLYKRNGKTYQRAASGLGKNPNKLREGLLTDEERSKKHSEVAKRLIAENRGGPRGGFKKKYHTEEQRREAQLRHANAWNAKASASHRDIGLFPIFPTLEHPSESGIITAKGQPGIDWDRRMACKHNLRLFAKTYMPQVFNLEWSTDQIRCADRLQEVIIEDGKFALTMPRGGGKTALCRAGLVWAIAYGHRRHPFFIGSKENKAVQTLAAIKIYWERSPLLLQDFPELAWAIVKQTEKSWGRASGQLFLGESTFLIWGSDEVRFPALLLPKEIAEVYLEHDEDSLLAIPDRFDETGNILYMPKPGGAIISTAGIDGSIRGDAPVHPITLEQMRPDVVLLDDVQKDQRADSPIMCEKLIRLIKGAVEGLAGPGQTIATLMPCTVIREGDAADTFVDPVKEPDWNGERCKMVLSWPPGITDYEITNDTESGKRWNEYEQLRRQKLSQSAKRKLLNDFYRKHRKELEEGFEVSWKERYNKTKEVSAIQHAMEKRFASPDTFLSEYQNIGRKLTPEAEIRITAEQLARKVVAFPQRELPPEVEILVAHIDVQTEIMFYSVFACDHNYNGVFVDYGTWPRMSHRYFTKAQTESWSMITSEFFKRYPEHRAKAISNAQGKVRAPLEAKIYFALSEIVPELLGRVYVRQDTYKRQFNIQKLSIDTRWGDASEVIKRYIREQKRPELVPYQGQAFPPTNRQLEEYERRPGWLFEDTHHPNIREPKWVMRPHQSDGSWYMSADVNRLKDFLFARLATPQGAPGSVSLFKAPEDDHELFSQHICNSEFPEPVTARGITKNQWTLREGTAYNNDWLDCAAGNMALASLCGASFKTSDKGPIVIRRKLSDRYAEKRKAKAS